MQNSKWSEKIKNLLEKVWFAIVIIFTGACFVAGFLPSGSSGGDYISTGVYGPEYYSEYDQIDDYTNYGESPDEAWGELEESEGERVYDTLTKEQQDLVNYPPFDENCVYWVPNGKSYHSVDWCYTLTRSKTINSGSLDEAFSKGKSDPCSKCVSN